jgi:hypothetical protein
LPSPDGTVTLARPSRAQGPAPEADMIEHARCASRDTALVVLAAVNECRFSAAPHQQPGIG